MQYRTSLEAYDALLRLVRRFTKFCGADILDENYRIDFRTIALSSMVASYLVFDLFSVYHYYPDGRNVVEVCSILGLGFQGAIKMYTCIANSKQYRERNNFLRNFHRLNSTGQPKNNAVLLDVLVKMHFCKTILLLAYFSAMVLVLVSPVGYFLLYGETMLAINVVIPGVDPNTVWGYFITQTYQWVLIVVAVVGIAAMDLLMLVVIATAAGLIEVCKNKLEELNELLEGDAMDRVKVREMVKEIIERHQEISRYESELSERYIVVNFVQLASSVSIIGLNLFLCYMYDYVQGYAFILSGMFQLMEFCFLGTIFSVKNEELTRAIYNTKWNLMEKPEQLSLALMLHQSQNSVDLTAGGFIPVNVETFVDIVKNIYKCFAMLITFMEP